MCWSSLHKIFWGISFQYNVNNIYVYGVVKKTFCMHRKQTKKISHIKQLVWPPEHIKICQTIKLRNWLYFGPLSNLATGLLLYSELAKLLLCRII